MGLKRFLAEVMRKITRKKKEIKADMDSFENKIDQQQKEYEDKYGDPKKTNFSDIMKQAGKDQDGETDE